jgi:hypothetical protein
MLDVFALVACLTVAPGKCAIVHMFSNVQACEGAKTYLEHAAPNNWAPLHCERNYEMS